MRSLVRVITVLVLAMSSFSVAAAPAPQTGATAPPLTLTFWRGDRSGNNPSAPPETVVAWFLLGGLDLQSLSRADLGSGLHVAGARGWMRNDGANALGVILNASAAPGTYQVTLQVPDGRRAETAFALDEAGAILPVQQPGTPTAVAQGNSPMPTRSTPAQETLDIGPAWTSLAAPPKWPNAGAVGPDGHLYVIGTNVPSGPGWLTTKETLAYDPSTNRWTPAASAPIAIAVTGAVAGGPDGRIYGVNASGEGPQAAVFSPSSNQWAVLPTLPRPRQFLVLVAAHTGLLYAVGPPLCVDNELEAHANHCFPAPTLDIYDPATNAWTNGPALPLPIQFGAAAAIESPDGAIDVLNVGTLQVYSPADGTWSVRKPAPYVSVRPAGLIAGPTDGRIYAFGLQIEGGRSWVYDQGTDTWTPGPANPPPHPTSMNGLVALADGRLLRFGGDYPYTWLDGLRLPATAPVPGPWANGIPAPELRPDTSRSIRLGEGPVPGPLASLLADKLTSDSQAVLAQVVATPDPAQCAADLADILVQQPDPDHFLLPLSPALNAHCGDATDDLVNTTTAHAAVQPEPAPYGQLVQPRVTGAGPRTCAPSECATWESAFLPSDALAVAVGQEADWTELDFAFGLSNGARHYWLPTVAVKPYVEPAVRAAVVPADLAGRWVDADRRSNGLGELDIQPLGDDAIEMRLWQGWASCGDWVFQTSFRGGHIDVVAQSDRPYQGRLCLISVRPLFDGTLEVRSHDIWRHGAPSTTHVASFRR